MFIHVEEQIKNLHTKIQLLLKQYQHVQKENQQLKKELEKQKAALQTKEDKLAALQQQVDVLKIGTRDWKDSSRKELEKRLDGYLKEVEKCLALLNA